MEKNRKVSLVERIGRKLPEISILFLILTFITIVFSAILAGVHEFAHVEDVTVKSVLTAEGYLYVLDNMIANFIGFAPLGIVLGIVIGVGVAEKTGMLGVVLKQIGLKAPIWALAPIFIPMLYGANDVLTPDVVQVAYRVADSSTNIISPLMSYTGIVILYGKRYVKDFNYGTLMDMMYPYSFGFLAVWTLFLVIWLVAGIPLGV